MRDGRRTRRVLKRRARIDGAAEKRLRRWLRARCKLAGVTSRLAYKHIIRDLVGLCKPGGAQEKMNAAEFSAQYRMAKSFVSIFEGTSSAMIAGAYNDGERATIAAAIINTLARKGWRGVLVARRGSFLTTLVYKLGKDLWVAQSTRIAPGRTVRDDIRDWTRAFESSDLAPPARAIVDAAVEDVSKATGLSAGQAEAADLTILHPDDLLDLAVTVTLPRFLYGVVDLDGEVDVGEWLPVVNHAGRLILVGKRPDLAAPLPPLVPSSASSTLEPLPHAETYGMEGDGEEWATVKVMWPVLRYPVVVDTAEDMTGRVLSALKEIKDGAEIEDLPGPNRRVRGFAWRCGITGAWLADDEIQHDDGDDDDDESEPTLGTSLPVLSREVDDAAISHALVRQVVVTSESVDMGENRAMPRRDGPSPPRYVRHSTWGVTTYTDRKDVRSCAACEDRLFFGQVRLSTEDARLFEPGPVTAENGVVCIPCAIEHGVRISNKGRMRAYLAERISIDDYGTDEDHPYAHHRDTDQELAEDVRVEEHRLTESLMHDEFMELVRGIAPIDAKRVEEDEWESIPAEEPTGEELPITVEPGSPSRVHVYPPSLHHVPAFLTWVLHGRRFHLEGGDPMMEALEDQLDTHVGVWHSKGGFPDALAAPLRDGRKGSMDVDAAVLDPRVTIINPRTTIDAIRAITGSDDVLPIDYGGFLKQWVTSHPFRRSIFIVHGPAPRLGASVGCFVHPELGEKWSIKLVEQRGPVIPAQFLIHNGHCFVPAQVDGLVTGIAVAAVLDYPDHAWPESITRAIQELASSFPETASRFVQRLVNSKRTSQAIWDATMEVLEATTSALASIQGSPQLWTSVLDVIVENTNSRSFRARIDVARPLRAWIAREAAFR